MKVDEVELPGGVFGRLPKAQKSCSTIINCKSYRRLDPARWRNPLGCQLCRTKDSDHLRSRASGRRIHERVGRARYLYAAFIRPQVLGRVGTGAQVGLGRAPTSSTVAIQL